MAKTIGPLELLLIILSFGYAFYKCFNLLCDDKSSENENENENQTVRRRHSAPTFVNAVETPHAYPYQPSPRPSHTPLSSFQPQSTNSPKSAGYQPIIQQPTAPSSTLFQPTAPSTSNHTSISIQNDDDDLPPSFDEAMKNVAK